MIFSIEFFTYSTVFSKGPLLQIINTQVNGSRTHIVSIQSAQNVTIGNPDFPFAPAMEEDTRRVRGGRSEWYSLDAQETNLGRLSGVLRHDLLFLTVSWGELLGVENVWMYI